jgi:hypothetical protein
MSTFTTNDFYAKVCNFRKNTNKRKELQRLTPKRPIHALNNGNFWLFIKTNWQFFQGYANDIWEYKGLEGPPISILTTSLDNKFQLITKDASHFHLEVCSGSMLGHILVPITCWPYPSSHPTLIAISIQVIMISMCVLAT